MEPSKCISLQSKYQRTKPLTQKVSNVKNELQARNLIDSDADSEMTPTEFSNPGAYVDLNHEQVDMISAYRQLR